MSLHLPQYGVFTFQEELRIRHEQLNRSVSGEFEPAIVLTPDMLSCWLNPESGDSGDTEVFG
jgi:hypothetical protein